MFHHVCIQREVQLFVLNIHFCDLKNKTTPLLVLDRTLSVVPCQSACAGLTLDHFFRGFKGLDNFSQVAINLDHFVFCSSWY